MTVALAYLHPGVVTHAFMASVLMTKARHPDLEIWPIKSGPLSLPESRNFAVGRLLESDHKWLWFADSDVGFGGDMLAGMLKIADESGASVLTVPIVALIDGPNDYLGGTLPQLHPSVYSWTADPDVVESLPLPLSADAVFAVDACATAMLLIHRSVLKTLGPDCFDRIGKLGEDLSFCRRLADKGIKVYATTRLRCTHNKLFPLG